MSNGSRKSAAWRWLVAAAVALSGLGAWGGSGAASSRAFSVAQANAPLTPAVARSAQPAALSAPLPAPAHIAVIVMENKRYGQVIGARSAPFINSLARRAALARAMYATTHPSLPNYLALTGGSRFGLSSDCTGCSVSDTSIVAELQAAHISWKAYMENLPRPCFSGASAGGYTKQHDPFMYFAGVRNNPAWCSRVVPLAQLRKDERSGTLPRFIWITPNLCHDTHDCGVSTGDQFLSRIVPPLSRSLGQHGLLFLTWDEGTGDGGCCRLAAGGHVATIVAGPGARKGGRLSTPTDHYSVLQTIEDLLGVPRLRGAACSCTPSLKPLVAGA